MKTGFAIALLAAIAQAQAGRNPGLSDSIAVQPTHSNGVVSALETRTTKTASFSDVGSVAEREADKNAARGQVQSDRRSTNEPDRAFVAKAQATGGMDLGYVTNDESYFAGRGINKSKIQWVAPTAAAGATQQADKFVLPGSSCGDASVALATSSGADVWGFKAHPSLANTFYIYARGKTDCTDVWLTASSTCATTTVTLSTKPSDEGLWELDPYPQANWDNDAYTFAGKYSIRSFFRENSNCEATLLAN